MAARRGFTLLEVLLALFLTTVTLSLLLFAMQINAGIIDKCDREVKEATMARALLQQIKFDLINAVPYVPGGSTSGSGGSGASGASSSSAAGSSSSGTGSASSSGTGSISFSSSISYASGSSGSGTSSTPGLGGIFGDSQTIQIGTRHRQRMSRAILAGAEDGAPLSQLGDVRVVTYSLSPVTSISPDGPSTSGESSGGLYRTDMDRLQFYTAMENDGSEADATVEKLEDPESGEIAELKFTYYDGSTENDSWDSLQEGKLPSSVRVTLSIRRSAKTSSGSFLGGLGANSQERPATAYDILVDLPNAAVSASELQSLAQVDKMKLSSGGGSMSSGSAAQ